MQRYVWFIGTNNHHSLLPPSGRTSSSRSCNACIYTLFFILTFSSSAWLLLVSSYQACDYWCNDQLFWFFFLGIFMFFFMFFFSSWVHEVSYRFHALKIPLLPFIIESWMWMDNQGYFKASLRRRLLLRLTWTRTVLHGYYHGYILHHL